MTNTYIVRKDDMLICGNCRVRLPHIMSTCSFCNGSFSNYVTILEDMFHAYEVGQISKSTLYSMLSPEDIEIVEDN